MGSIEDRGRRRRAAVRVAAGHKAAGIAGLVRTMLVCNYICAF